jgi:hypothetical protein
MFKLHSISGRIAIGKFIGLVVGVAVMLLLPSFDMSIYSMFGLGTLVMFILMGVVTGFMGILDRHPMLEFKMPWWIRGTLVGASFMLMYVLFTYDTLDIIMQSSLVSWTGLTSPFWAILDGIFIGGVMGFIETKFAGEGPKLPVS